MYKDKSRPVVFVGFFGGFPASFYIDNKNNGSNGNKNEEQQTSSSRTTTTIHFSFIRSSGPYRARAYRRYRGIQSRRRRRRQFRPETKVRAQFFPQPKTRPRQGSVVSTKNSRVRKFSHRRSEKFPALSSKGFIDKSTIAHTSGAAHPQFYFGLKMIEDDMKRSKYRGGMSAPLPHQCSHFLGQTSWDLRKSSRLIPEKRRQQL